MKVRWRAGWLAAMLLAAPAAAARIGEPAPPFRAEDLAGTPHTLAGARGRVVVIAYWATWCAPCRPELAALDKAYRVRRGDGLDVIAVTDERGVSPARVRRWTEGFAFPVAIGLAEGGADYGPVGGALPSTYVIDRTGTVRFRRAGTTSSDELARLLATLLAEPGRP